jgi:DNA-binding SARP family transcriptional activator
MSLLRASLFGKFKVQCDEQDLAGLDSRKAQELFCYLLLYRDRHHPRETLAGLLWGEVSTARSKRYLSKALWHIRDALACQTELSEGRLLLIEPEWIRLHPEAYLWLDIDVFEQAFNLVQGVPGTKLDSALAQNLQHAVALYRGDLLEDCYQDWCLYERERLQHIYLAMLDKLMAFCEVRGEHEAGLKYGMRILRYDRARERTHRRLMRLHYLAGDRTMALRQYGRCVAALDEELGVKPAERTLMLYDQIRSDQLGGSPLPPAGTTSLPTPVVLARLERLHAVLADTQRHIQRELQLLKQTTDRES